MVGSWNMLIYGTGMYVMESTSSDKKPARTPAAFAFYFLGLTNLMFNWGHHTYIVPAAAWVKMVAYIICMTELIILAHLIMLWRRTMNNARKNYHLLPYRFLSYADAWILLNLTLAIIISVPAWNYYTHGTHITVAHAMGTTIGINTMILFASVFYLLQKEYPFASIICKKLASTGIIITNIALLVFWISLLGSGIIKISGKLNNQSFYTIMKKSEPFFRVFTFSGVFVMAGLVILIIAAIKIIVTASVKKIIRSASVPVTKSIQLNSPDQDQIMN